VWIQHALAEAGRRLDRLEARLDRIDVRLDGIRAVTLCKHGERIAQLEAREG
jgi:hypothetical protein